MTHNAYLVWGAESSGTRLITQTLCAYGCQGSHEHEQPFDIQLPLAIQPIVWRRSFPHAHEWPDTTALVQHVTAVGFNPVFVIVYRDKFATVESQVKIGHVENRERGEYNYRLAYSKIFQALVEYSQLRCVSLSYANFIKRPRLVMQKNFPELMGVINFNIQDMNTKHYGG